MPLPQVVKNHFASEFIYNKYKNEKTCGVIEEDVGGGMSKVAEPVGVIAGEAFKRLPRPKFLFVTELPSSYHHRNCPHNQPNLHCNLQGSSHP